MIKAFLRKYALGVIVFSVLFIVITLFLMILTSSPQEGGFIYQIN